MAALHERLTLITQSDMITQVIYDIAQNPEVIEPLRKEMVEVLTKGGWKKTSLYNLKLLDSVIKESQRLKPIGSGKPLFHPDFKGSFTPVTDILQP